MGEKLRNIRETASDAVEIISMLRTPEIQASLDKLSELSGDMKSILESIKDPVTSRNIENIMAAAEAARDAAARIENAAAQFKDTGADRELVQTLISARNIMDAVALISRDHETALAAKEMFASIKDLMNELRATVISSRSTGTVHELKQAISEASNAYKNLRE